MYKSFSEFSCPRIRIFYLHTHSDLRYISIITYVYYTNLYQFSLDKKAAIISCAVDLRFGYFPHSLSFRLFHSHIWLEIGICSTRFIIRIFTWLFTFFVSFCVNVCSFLISPHFAVYYCINEMSNLLRWIGCERKRKHKDYYIIK